MNTMKKTWTRALAEAKHCGQLAARQYRDRIPEWKGEPILHMDWEYIEDALGYSSRNLDDYEINALGRAWLNGYNELCK